VPRSRERQPAQRSFVSARFHRDVPVLERATSLLLALWFDVGHVDGTAMCGPRTAIAVEARTLLGVPSAAPSQDG